MNDPAVREIDAADRSRAVSVEVVAFSADPIMRWMYPDPHAYLESFPRFVEAFGGLAFEQGTAYEAGDFGGVSLWLPVGVHVDPGPLEELFRETLAPSILDEAFPMLEKMGEYHIEEPHWYLPMIGVDTSQQGRGLGSALLAHRLRECDEQGLPAYLESSNPANISLYQRHGFEVIGEFGVEGAPS